MRGRNPLKPSRRTHVPVRLIIPNVLTTVSLCSGLVSMHFALKSALNPGTGERWDLALMAIGVSALFDALDGRAARILRATSRFGAVFDSLSDFLAFGIAPATLLYLWALKDSGVLGIAAVMTFILCSGLRLARFTSVLDTKPVRPSLGSFFEGLPTPAAAGSVLIPVMLDASKYVHIKQERMNQAAQDFMHNIVPALIVAHTFLIAFFMISRVPMFSFKKMRIAKTMVVPLMVVVGLLVLALSRDPWLTMSILTAAYLLSVPLSLASYRKAIRQIDAAPVGVG